MEKKRSFGSLGAVLVLAGLAYLGFWVFGLVMGVYGPGELIGFTVIAVLILVALAVNAYRERHRPDEADGQEAEELQRRSRHQREVRGF